MMHSDGDESLVGRLSNVEVALAGQAFRLGRYPVHFHMIGTVNQSFVRDCSVHDTYNVNYEPRPEARRPRPPHAIPHVLTTPPPSPTLRPS